MPNPINKIKFGLKNVHYAVVQELNGVATYGLPKSIPGAVSLVLNAASEALMVPADDNPEYYREETNNGYEGTLEVQNLPDDFYADVYGRTVDANGLMVENANDAKSKIALLYEFDGDQKKTRFVDYNVFCQRPNVTGQTKTTSKTPITDSIPIFARPAIDTGDVRGRAKYGDAAYTDFYSAVALKNAPINTVASATASFSKAAPADVTFNLTSSDGTNTIRNVYIDGAWIPGVSLSITGVDVTLAQAFIAALDNGVYSIVVQPERGNSVTVALAVAA